MAWRLPVSSVQIRESSANGRGYAATLKLFLPSAFLALVTLTAKAEVAEAIGPEQAPAQDSEAVKAQAAEWDSFNAKAEQDVLPMLDRVPDQDGFDLEPPKSWKWWDERETTEGKAIRGRFLRWLKANPLTEGASDANLWFTILLFEGTARMAGRIEALESRIPDNAPFAGGFGSGSDRERFHLWTGCKPLWPAIFVEEEGAFRDSIKAAVESRLRSARLYSEDVPGSLLRIDVDQGDSSTYRISVGLQKTVFDPVTGLNARVYSDYLGGQRYGSYGFAPQESVRSVLADLMDRFIADYLRVNAEACGVSAGEATHQRP